MEEKKNEVDKFFEGLPSQDKKLADVFNEIKPTEEVVIEKKKEGDEESEGRKNRRHRRLEEQLQRERGSNIALSERIKVLAEVRSGIKESTEGETPAEWIALLGDTPESHKAWKLQQDLLHKSTQQAKQEVLQEIENKSHQDRIEFQEEQTKYEGLIDSELEALEDAYNIDLTSNTDSVTKIRKEFLELIQKVSPKDEEGNITNYADFGSTFELYQLAKVKEKSSISDKQKELASRSMQTSGQGGGSETQKVTSGFRGWMKDYNL